MAEKKYLNYEGLQDVAGHVNTRLKTVTSIPVSADNGAVRLYVGTTTDTYIRGHIYQYNSTDSEWVDITSTVIANPTGTATDELEKIQIGSDIYSVGSTIQVSTMPTASADYVGKIYQYIGTTTSAYTHGYFYECKESNNSYSWQEVNVQTLPTLGTAASKDVPTSGDASATQVVMGNDSRLTDNRTDANAYHTDDSTESTLANDDAFPFLQAGQTPVKKKTLWSNIKAKLKNYFDQYYNYSSTLSVNFTNEGTASSNSSKKQILSTTNDLHLTNNYTIDGTEYLEQTVTLGTTDTTVTFNGFWQDMDLNNHYYFYSDTVVSVYAGRATGDVSGAQNQFPYKSIYVDGTNHTCSIVFPALSSAVSVKVRVYIR